MLNFKKMAPTVLALMATVALGGTQAALADHDDFRRGHNSDHWRQSTNVYRTHSHNKVYYNRGYNNRAYNYNRHHTIKRDIHHVLRRL